MLIGRYIQAYKHTYIYLHTYMIVGSKMKTISISINKKEEKRLKKARGTETIYAFTKKCLLEGIEKALNPKSTLERFEE